MINQNVLEYSLAAHGEIGNFAARRPSRRGRDAANGPPRFHIDDLPFLRGLNMRNVQYAACFGTWRFNQW
jgi:hypothetical protein